MEESVENYVFTSYYIKRKVKVKFFITEEKRVRDALNNMRFPHILSAIEPTIGVEEYFDNVMGGAVGFSTQETRS